MLVTVVPNKILIIAGAIWTIIIFCFVYYKMDHSVLLSPGNKPQHLVNNERLAFATMLTSTATDQEDDPYYAAVTLMAYKLLHHPNTKTKRGIPFLVLVTENIPIKRRNKLKKLGARVEQVNIIYDEFERKPALPH